MKTLETIGKYKVLDTLGQGAMGIVYKALDPDIDREVAIKTIRFDMLSDAAGKDEIMRRFIREAQAVGKLEHPSIITIYEVGREGDLTYIVMQLAKGKSLKEILDSGKSYKPSEIVRLMERMCEALDYAHSQGVIHRDVKPANILIDDTGNPFLVDFGVARLEMSTMTTAGSVMGTPSYMSPEQVMGKSVDSRADLFSLGVILFELFTNRRPFEGDHITTVVYKIAHEDPPTLSQVRNTGGVQAFEPIIRKALAKNPKDRYQTGRDLSADLQKVALPFGSDETMFYESAHEGEQKTTWRPYAIIGGGFIIVAATFVFLFPRLFGNKPEEVETVTQVLPLSLNASDIYDGAAANKEDRYYSLPRGSSASSSPISKKAVNPEIQKLLSSGRSSFQQGNYLTCRNRMDEVLKREPDNLTAKQLRGQANVALTSIRDIKAIIERQEKLEESETLELLAVFDPSIRAKRKSDMDMLFNNHRDIETLIPESDVEVILNGNIANVRFVKIVQAVAEADGVRKMFFRGRVRWRVEKKSGRWVITDYEATEFN